MVARDLSCGGCGRTFQPQSDLQLHCSPICGNRVRNRRYMSTRRVPRLYRNCEDCGSHFVTNKSNRRFCSDICHNRAIRKRVGREVLTARVRCSHRKNPEPSRASARRFAWKHRERLRPKQRLHAKIRRIHKGNPSATAALWIAKCAYYGWRCHYCGAPLDITSATIDHKIPVSLGGLDLFSNLAPACLPCNSSKRDRPYAKYKQSH